MSEKTLDSMASKKARDSLSSKDTFDSVLSEEPLDSMPSEEPLDSMPSEETLDSMPSEELLYDLADLFKVFADTTRIKILYALMGKDMCVADIAQVIGATQSAVSHQLRLLKQAHLVKFVRDGKNVVYSLSDDHVYTVLAQGMTHICE